MRNVLFNLLLGLISAFFITPIATNAEHPTEHPTKKAAEKSEHPAEHPEKAAKLAEKANAEHPEHPTAKNAPVTKADISAGIKSHIAKEVMAGGGAYQMDYEGNTLALTLLKVHEDKLAQLDNGQHFACTDLEGSDGNTYDVDFFLEGHAGARKVIEKAVHKINDAPLYSWSQNEDGHWARVIMGE